MSIVIFPRSTGDEIGEHYGAATLKSGLTGEEYTVGQNAKRIYITNADSITEEIARDAGFSAGVCPSCNGAGRFSCNGKGSFDTALAAMTADWNGKWIGWSNNPRVWIVEMA